MSNLQLIPAIAELAQLDQWVISKYVPRHGKLDKPPFSPHTRRLCSHSNPADWSSYDAARAALVSFDWLGFVFYDADPYSGIDLDGCRDKATGEIEGWAQRIIDQADSYTEISPSGKGVKIFVRGTLADTVIHKLGEHKGIEVYSKQRYFTVTAQHLAGTPTEIRAAQSLLDQLQHDYAPPKVEQPRGVINITPRASAGRASLADVKARFNAEHPLPSLLSSYNAVQTSSKDWTCPFCEHSHANTLFIYNDRVYSRSPNCKIPQKRGLDSFGLYVLIDHNDDPIAAVKKLNPIAPRTARQQTPLATPQPVRTQTPEQAADAQRKRTTRRTVAAATIADVQARASQDDTLSDNAQLVLLALLDVAGDRDWCRPSVARLVDMLPISRRSVFYGLRDLEGTYIKSDTQRGGTTRRTFIRVQSRSADAGAFAPEYIHDHDSVPTLEASERAPISPACELDYWQAADLECSGYDLALEDLELAPVEPEPPAPSAAHQVPEIAPDGPIATYDPTAALQLAGEYTGRPKHFVDFSTRWAWSCEAIKPRADVDDDQPEQLDRAPSHRARRAPEITAFDRYLVELARMDDRQLAGELQKHQRTLKKHAGAAWLKSKGGPRDKLNAVQEAIDRYDSPPGALERPSRRSERDSTGPRPPYKLQPVGLPAAQQVAFL